ncbi:hypothetical protein LshimejAT787_0311420 [Lyophyllum shimeji]|uniref:Uncharacterized protein n=1 Tax=Lyophyllum shimeji TaxID=47721 RepID=A0A9P3PIK5_LYOSH|nr:hypothetical protein LshimejAT787_0311420 [Lyophyllum shimeji]
MLPNPQSFPSTSRTSTSGYGSTMQPGYSAVQPFPNQQAFLPDHSLHQGTDPNSPATFQQNIQLVQQHVAELQNLARSTLAGIQNAYHPGHSPAQSEANIVALKQALKATADLLLQSGVGALPVLPVPGPGETVAAPTEEQLLSDANRSIKLLYEQLRRNQESAAVVANLLAAPDRGGK